MTDVSKYRFTVVWSEEDQEYVGTCAEFGFLSHLDESPEAAFSGIKQVVADAIELLQEDGEPVPSPLSAREYSGKFNVRVPKELHRLLAAQAHENGVSLNQLVTQKLASN